MPELSAVPACKAGEPVKALSIKQPWAHLVIHGQDGAYKTIETRVWQTHYRGDLLIVSSKLPVARPWAIRFDAAEMEFGKAIGIVDLVDCRVMTRDDETAAMCGIYRDAWSWVFEKARAIEPFEVQGQLRLYDVAAV
jgi:ASCH domain